MKILFIGQSISKMRDPLKRPKDPTPAFFGGGQNGMRLVDSLYCTFFLFYQFLPGSTVQKKGYISNGLLSFSCSKWLMLYPSLKHHKSTQKVAVILLTLPLRDSWCSYNDLEMSMGKGTDRWAMWIDVLYKLLSYYLLLPFNSCLEKIYRSKILFTEPTSIILSKTGDHEIFIYQISHFERKDLGSGEEGSENWQ